jgi:TolB-like protein/DNA-binding winged helix-turn-helix (wHTH) protein
MGVPCQPRGVWGFGVFCADLDAGELCKSGWRVHLQDQPFQVLAVLLLRAGQLVTREELRREVWPRDTFVEFDHALNTAVKKIRIAIGDDANAPRYIETIPKRGYRFIAPVQAASDLLSTPVVHPASNETRSRPNLSWPNIALALAMAVVVIGLAGVLGLHRLRAGTPFASARVVVAVLPFEDATEDLKLAGLCDGVTQELISQLGRTEPAKLSVAARANVLTYRHSVKSVAQVGAELRADYLIEGSVRRDGRHLRLSAELIRVSDQARIWGDDFDSEDDDTSPLIVETDIAKAIVMNVRPALLAEPGH